MSTSGLNMSRRIRRTPYTDRVEACGVSGFSVVNHMLLPKAYQRSVEEDYWHLRSRVQIWDVACQRQVEVSGPDAAKLVQYMTPRNLTRARVGQCLYVPLIDDNAGMVNDPILLKLDDQRFWLSIADSDVLLWAKGLALGAKMDVIVEEPDVSPLGVQGPDSAALLASVFGAEIHQLPFFGFAEFEFLGTRQIIARSGYSKPDGFEIYLNDSALGAALWDLIWTAGAQFDIAPGCPNLIDRVEAGLLSYGNEMTRANNPFECGMTRYCDLSGDIEYVGKDALRRIWNQGIARQIRGVVFGGARCPPCVKPWPVLAGNDDLRVGQITTGIYSPGLQSNIALAMIDRAYWQAGQAVTVLTSDGVRRPGKITELPFS